jgi:small subunit ribosomal protein S1
MTKKDIFGDEVGKRASEDFGSLLEMSERGRIRNLKNGDQIKGEILAINRESVFVATGTPTDGVLPLSEILDEKLVPKFKVGEVIDVIVVRQKSDEILLRFKGAKGISADVENLEDAFDMELPIEGKVLEVVKGGYRVLVHGQKAFCPISQMDQRVSPDTAQYVGNKYTFLVTQFENQGRNIVVSRRKILDLEKAENEGTFLQKFKIGDILPGTVKRIEKYGAFIELEGGLEGMAHISEIAWGRIQDPSEIVRIGQAVTVKLLKVEEEQNRLKIALSIKQGGGEGDPWMSIFEKFPVGTVVQGVVDKKENFGLFVQVSPGLNGLLPRSKWKEEVNGHEYDNKKKGDVIPVQIDQILFEEKKISLRVPTEAADESWRTHQASGNPGLGNGSGKGLGSGGLGGLAELMKKGRS